VTPDEQAVENLLETLAASLNDLRLADEEKRELALILREHPPREEDLRRARNFAFDLVRKQASDPSQFALLKWLEGVVRTLDNGRMPSTTSRQNACFSPGTACLEAIRTRLRNTRRHAEICVFTLSDDRISDEVLAAHHRGVAVRLLTDNLKEFDAGSDIGRLRDAGVAIAVDRTEAHMHHKFAIFDGEWLLSGSYNWTRSACELNEENIIQSNDAALLKQFSEHFERLWAKLAN
jgi:phosphatidylserine/phosphatidylglycerophosphate/cardiolipin synthase-like enzyme